MANFKILLHIVHPLNATLRFFFFFGLFRVLHLNLAVVQVGEGVGEHLAGAEVDLGSLDEGGVVVFLGQGTFAREGYLEGAEVAQADDLTVLDTFGHHIFQCYENGIYVALVHGTRGLDTVGHVADVHVATGLGLGIKLRTGVLVSWVLTRNHRIRN